MVALPAPQELSNDLVAGTLRLRSWALYDASPDRLLAVRQVASLYESPAVFMQPLDVLDGAEVVYAGLRSDAVAEVVRSVREAQGVVLDTVRQTSQSAQDLTKSATERFLASLAALVAIVATSGATGLSQSERRHLMLFVAVTSLILMGSHLVLEGPTLSLQVRRLPQDLRQGEALLTEHQVSRLLGLPSVNAVKRRVKVIRVVIPAAYALLAVLVLIFGYPSSLK